MDKIKIGKYLKNLRLTNTNQNGKQFTQDYLANIFSKQYGCIISINAIAEWENGKSLPSLDNLKILSEIYGKTIDEILDGEDKKNIDYSEKYFIHKETWGTKFDDKSNLYQIINEQIKLIVDRFKELILIRIEREFSFNEEREFRFLFENFYLLSDYAKECFDINIKDNYLVLKFVINKMLIKIKDMSIEEKYWEIQKLYSENTKLWFRHWNDVHDLKNVVILQNRFDTIEDWQKDMLLAMFQNIEPFDNDPTKYGSDYLKRYENENGEYDYEKLIKSEIKELIKHGACVNKYFLNIKQTYYEDRRIIDRLEELYNLCLKPIKIYTTKDSVENCEVYKVENNAKNRFLKDYYLTLKYQIKGYGLNHNCFDDIDELYSWFLNNEKISDEIYLQIAKKNKIDVNREKKYWLADAKIYCQSLEEKFKEFKQKEKDIADGLKEIDILKEKLSNGEKEYKIQKSEIIGGNDEQSIREYIEYWKTKLTYNEFLKHRDKKLTKQLLKEIDTLSFEEIKEKYFPLEVIKND